MIKRVNNMVVIDDFDCTRVAAHGLCELKWDRKKLMTTLYSTVLVITS